MVGKSMGGRVIECVRSGRGVIESTNSGRDWSQLVHDRSRHALYLEACRYLRNERLMVENSIVE